MMEYLNSQNDLVYREGPNSSAEFQGSDGHWYPSLWLNEDMKRAVCFSPRPPIKDADKFLVQEPIRTSFARQSDVAGIIAFVPPPLVVKSEPQPRVSTFNRAWRWL